MYKTQAEAEASFASALKDMGLQALDAAHVLLPPAAASTGATPALPCAAVAEASKGGKAPPTKSASAAAAAAMGPAAAAAATTEEKENSSSPDAVRAAAAAMEADALLTSKQLTESRPEEGPKPPSSPHAPLAEALRAGPAAKQAFDAALPLGAKGETESAADAAVISIAAPHQAEAQPLPQATRTRSTAAAAAAVEPIASVPAPARRVTRAAAADASAGLTNIKAREGREPPATAEAETKAAAAIAAVFASPVCQELPQRAVGPGVSEVLQAGDSPMAVPADMQPSAAAKAEAPVILSAAFPAGQGVFAGSPALDAAVSTGLADSGVAAVAAKAACVKPAAGATEEGNHAPTTGAAVAAGDVGSEEAGAARRGPAGQKLSKRKRDGSNGRSSSSRVQERRGVQQQGIGKGTSRLRNRASVSYDEHKYWEEHMQGEGLSDSSASEGDIDDDFSSGDEEARDGGEGEERVAKRPKVSAEASKAATAAVAAGVGRGKGNQPPPLGAAVGAKFRMGWGGRKKGSPSATGNPAAAKGRAPAAAAAPPQLLLPRGRAAPAQGLLPMLGASLGQLFPWMGACRPGIVPPAAAMAAAGGPLAGSTAPAGLVYNPYHAFRRLPAEGQVASAGGSGIGMSTGPLMQASIHMPVVPPVHPRAGAAAGVVGTSSSVSTAADAVAPPKPLAAAAAATGGGDGTGSAGAGGSAPLAAAARSEAGLQAQTTGLHLGSHPYPWVPVPVPSSLPNGAVVVAAARNGGGDSTAGLPGPGHTQPSGLHPGMMYVPVNHIMLQAQLNAMAAARARLAVEQQKHQDA